MNETSHSLLTSKVEAAFRQASQEVVRVAKQTGTPVIVWKDGRVYEIPCDRLDELLLEDRSPEPAH
jgi:alpha-tubulin suppressor-like RCC1 family protein